MTVIFVIKDVSPSSLLNQPMRSRAHRARILHFSRRPFGVVDGLSACWEASAQAHMKARGFEHRQIREITLGTRYEGKIVGDSPEMSRALDFLGFADLKAAILSYVSFTSNFDNDDPRKFNLGTPDAVFSCIERAFSVAPTSKRIVEDIPWFLTEVSNSRDVWCPMRPFAADAALKSLGCCIEALTEKQIAIISANLESCLVCVTSSRCRACPFNDEEHIVCLQLAISSRQYI